MALLDSLAPQQRKILLYGAPVVAAAALYATSRKNAASEDTEGGERSPSSSTPTTGFMPATTIPSDNAIGVGQLAEFESALAGALTELGTRVDSLDPGAGLASLSDRIDSLTAGGVTQAPTPDEQFVTSLYWAYLKRAPDTAGLHYWVSLLGQGYSRTQVAEAFAASARAETG